MQAGVRGERGMLRGLKLSDAEKAKLKEIHGKYAAQSKSLRESMKEVRAARQKGDTATARAVLVRNKGTIDKLRTIRASEQAEIRGALSPDNQKQFDANVAKSRADRKANGRGGRHADQRAGVKG
jgi:Spy/CpxP family protein refolding chaperone